MPDPLAADLRDPAVLAALEALGAGRIDVLDEVGSTNEQLTAAVLRQARGAAPARPWTDLSLLLTGHQSAGRGRLDRVWTTEPGTALTFSVLLRPAGAGGRPLPTQHFPWLTLLMAAAVVEALAGVAGAGARIKWPNDVLVDGRKVAGLLAGLVLDPHRAPAVVLGTGINVSQEELPVATATSVRRATGRDVARAAVLEAVLGAFVPRYRQFCADPAAATGPGGPLRRLVEDRMETLGRSVRAELPGGAEPVTGTAVGLGAHGGLLLRDDAGTEHEVTAGDVVHLRPAAPGKA
ncbi:biotin--[acetyl-CoA-carboxylase] ligase [Kocuria sp. CNJ-770]|uniref:biotin--[acetyl-CoA-carboxylase] ligase n=1 Tax=Kocuria sp. CNJ-770 TaxID=1904964 RepID=UPI0009645040|nr:biotin--[acetyl-CoA-carboxylase] ligase [Kocuria sp. CNJ-770]OLT04106.1 biotin--[acetyl-CoA-carboxylase] ligase [Kocuria sp. CNJ-770]